METPTLALLARGGFAGPGEFFLLLILALFAGLAFWLIRRRGSSPGRDAAMATLETRFARGEIDRDEFEHRKAVLIGADVVPPSSGNPGISRAEE